MDKTFILEKQKFIENYNLARPIMTILGDEVRQEILLTLIEAGGRGGIRVGEIQKKKPCFAFSSITSSQSVIKCWNYQYEARRNKKLLLY